MRWFRENLETYMTDLKFCDDFIGRTCFIANLSNERFGMKKTTIMLPLKDVYLDHVVYHKKNYLLSESYIGNDIYTKQEVFK